MSSTLSKKGKSFEPHLTSLSANNFKLVDYKFSYLVLPFPKPHILDSSKLKDFADDNFKLNGNERKFFKRVENTVGKGEIAHYKQFLRFPLCFQKTCTTDT